VKNQYFLAIRCKYDGCTCCSRLPVTKVPVQIIPTVNEDLYNYETPADFKPTVYDECRF